ncbi:MAG: cell division protein FtsZ [Saprospiraceae bacterium]
MMQFNQSNGDSIIKVIGVGGGGSNAVSHMFNEGIVGVDFIICNTDEQSLELSAVPNKIQLGPELTEGRGAGSKPNIGREACVESVEEVKSFLTDNTKMVFITAGMGGGTGTGAAPVIAKIAQELDILTVGIVTLPFTFEGRRRQNQGFEGLEELKKNVDTIIVISNDKLRQIHGNLTLAKAFSNADNILATAAKGIAEIITVPGYINVDFEDVNTVMRNSGVAIMGTSAMEGENRARRAVEAALNSPLLEDNDIRGAQHILLNITSGTKEVTMDEVFEITEYVQEEAGYGTDLIWGNCYDETLGEKISVTVIATGFEKREQEEEKTEIKEEPKPIRKVVSLEDEVEVKRPYSTGYRNGEKKISYDLDPQPKYKNEQESVIRGEGRQDGYEIRQRRRERLNNLHQKLNNPQIVNDLESEPAYLRRKIELEDIPHSSESKMSKWSLSDDEKPELKRGNSFLHDNVD